LQHHVRFVAIVLIMVVTDFHAARACTVAPVTGSEALIRVEAINQRLISATILAEVNNARCRAGLRAVAASGGLAQVAAKHSGWMAGAGQLSHDSTLVGLASLRDRLAASGHSRKGGTENIGQVQRYLVDTVPGFRITDAATCRFATDDGQPIPAHSYRSLAHTIVDLWMKSPAHKANILNRKVRSLGSGIAFDGKAPWCGVFFLTQTFSD